MSDLTNTVHCILQKGDQQVSWTAKAIMSLYGIILFVLLVFVNLEKVAWLDFLYYCSYIKLTITLIKYIPQVSVFTHFVELFKPVITV